MSRVTHKRPQRFPSRDIHCCPRRHLLAWKATVRKRDRHSTDRALGTVSSSKIKTPLALVCNSPPRAPFRRGCRFQLVVQGGIFGSLFLMMFETYPFRVGLMGMLTKQYLSVYAINVVYFFMTASIYGYRVVRPPPSEPPPPPPITPKLSSDK